MEVPAVHIDVARARSSACRVFGDIGDYWHHTQTVALAAVEAAPTVRLEDRDLLVAAAWFHDIGHRPDGPTGFRPLEGALFLVEQGWPGRLTALVAHRSAARFVADARGILPDLLEFPHEYGGVVDALVYADMTAGPQGQRLPDIHRRHANDPPAMLEARLARDPHLILASARVDVRLQELGRDSHAALPVSRDLEELVTTELVARLASDHPHRGSLDVRAAVHASLSLVEVSRSTRVVDGERYAGDLLEATMTLGDSVLPVASHYMNPEPSCSAR